MEDLEILITNELEKSGMTIDVVAKEMGVTPTRIKQLQKSTRPRNLRSVVGLFAAMGKRLKFSTEAL
jgi:hypothetical protein